MNKMPTISELRKLLKPYEMKNNNLAFLLWFFDYALFILGQYAVIVLPVFLKIVGSLITFIVIGRLAILAHDAAHNSFTTSKKLNRFFSQTAFLPSLITFSGWSQVHHIKHHGFTNLVTKDDIWQPLFINRRI